MFTQPFSQFEPGFSFDPEFDSDVSVVSFLPLEKIDSEHLYVENSVPIYRILRRIGEGASGAVYEAERIKVDQCPEGLETQRPLYPDPIGLPINRKVALKSIAPVVYQFHSTTSVSACGLIVINSDDTEPNAAYSIAKQGKGVFVYPLSADKVFVLRHNFTNETFPALQIEEGKYKEMTLQECVSIYGLSPSTTAPIKFQSWLTKRRVAYREIINLNHCLSQPSLNIIGLYECFEQISSFASHAVISMELANIGDLMNYLTNSSICPSVLMSSTYDFLFQLMFGLSHCHACGICHRDVKPENILLKSCDVCQKKIIKLTDFGLSTCIALNHAAKPFNEMEHDDNKLSDDDNDLDKLPPPCPIQIRRLMSIVGSPSYIPPEVMTTCALKRTTSSSNGYDGFKVDSWCCGFVLYAMLVQGKFLPFPSGSSSPRWERFQKYVLSSPDIWNILSGDVSLDKKLKLAQTLSVLSSKNSCFPKWLFPPLETTSGGISVSNDLLPIPCRHNEPELPHSEACVCQGCQYWKQMKVFMKRPHFDQPPVGMMFLCVLLLHPEADKRITVKDVLQYFF